MTEYTAFRIDKKTLEKLRTVANCLERSMAGQVRFMVENQYDALQSAGKLDSEMTDAGDSEECAVSK